MRCFNCGVGFMHDYDRQTCVPCPIEAACLNGLLCENGYEGSGCANCINGWFSINDRCRKCPDTSIYLLITLGTVITFIFGYLVYHYSFGLVNFAGVSTISITHLQLVDKYIRLKIPIPDVFYRVIN